MEPSLWLPPDFLQGVIAPMFTPVHADHSLDPNGAKAFVEWLVSRKCVRTVFARSGMGKMYTFTVEETRRMGEAVMQAADGRIGVMIGAGGEWLERRPKDRSHRPDPERYLAQALELTRFVKRIGANAAVHPIPEALAPADGEPLEETVYRYYKTVHDSVDVPLVLYQPGDTAPEYRMTPDLLRRLWALPRVIGMKVSTHNDALFGELAEVVRGTRFALIAGDESYYLPALYHGAVGVIGVGCNMYPEVLHALRARFLAGDADGAARAQADVDKILTVTRGHDGTTTWKQVLIANGVAIEPYDRNGAALSPPEAVKKADAARRALCAAYAS